MKLTGAVLVLLGGITVFWSYSRALRRELALIRDLAGALTQLAGEIRWKMIPLPEGIRHLTNRRESGKFFSDIVILLESNTTLQEAWRSEFTTLSPSISDILCAIEWGGDLIRQEGSILYAASQMTELGESKKDALQQREKNCAAAALSAAGLLVMILM